MTTKLYRLMVLGGVVAWAMTGMYASRVLQAIDARGRADGMDLLLLGMWVLMGVLDVVALGLGVVLGVGEVGGGRGVGGGPGGRAGGS